MKQKLMVARELAQSHFAIDPTVRRIFLLGNLDEENPREPIKLLEVVEGTLEGDPWPVGFASDPARGIDYPFVIIEISPREFKALSKGHIRVDNSDWPIGEELLAHDHVSA